MKTVYIVDDSADFRESTAWMLEASGYSVHDSGDPAAALDELQTIDDREDCCLLLDVRMPGMNGLEFHDCLNRNRSRVPVVYMSGHADVPLAVEAMKKGAVTFLEKPLQYDALESALTLAFAAARQSLPMRESAEQLQAYRDRIASLTPREREVMERVVDGKANKVTALELDISIRTVELHRGRIMKKLKVNSGPELVRAVMLCQ